MIIKTLEEFYKDNNIIPQEFDISLPDFRWGMLNSPEKLQLLCNLSVGKSVLEIGTFIGATTYNLAKVADKVSTIDIDNVITDKDYGPYKVAEYIKSFSKSKRPTNIEQIIGDSKELDFSSFGETFDLVFIDGEASSEAVSNDFTKSLQILNSQGIIIFDDYLLGTGDMNYPAEMKITIDSLDSQYDNNFIMIPELGDFVIYQKV